MHRVGAGETLATIGKRYGTTPGSIIAANNLTADKLRSAQPAEGDRLLIPAVMRADPPARRAASASAAAHRPAKPAHKTPVILTHAVAR
jgi:hypothetical protein